MASTKPYFYDCNTTGILGTEVSQKQAQLQVVYLFLHINSFMLKIHILSKAKLINGFNFSYMKLISRTGCSPDNTEKAKWWLLQY